MSQAKLNDNVILGASYRLHLAVASKEVKLKSGDKLKYRFIGFTALELEVDEVDLNFPKLAVDFTVTYLLPISEFSTFPTPNVDKAVAQIINKVNGRVEKVELLTGGAEPGKGPGDYFKDAFSGLTKPVYIAVAGVFVLALVALFVLPKVKVG